MNISVEIEQIQKDLELMQDENLISTIKSLLVFAKTQKKQNQFMPFSIEEYKNRVEQSEEDIKMGRFINIDDL